MNKVNKIQAEKKVREKMIHIIKREQMPFWNAFAIRAVTVFIAFLVSFILVTILADKHPDPYNVLKTLIDGAFGTSSRIWKLLLELALLLGISLAITPAFKMKFWNCGAEGQVLIGGLATAACMFYFGDSMSLPLLLIVMTLASIVAGMIWAFIPAIFKAIWNTNETLFTLMMNYIAIQLVAFFIKIWVPNNTGTLNPMHDYGFPFLFGEQYLLSVLIVLVLTAFFYAYFRYSKQGYEISVVGESENTARYIGINVKKVIIRTMLISGAVCGIMGLIIVGCTDHTVSTNSAGGRGFTAIMISWLAKFNPLYMILTAFLVAFLRSGVFTLKSKYQVDSYIADIMIAIVLLFIIGCEFFINYKVVFNKNSAVYKAYRKIADPVSKAFKKKAGTSDKIGKENEGK